LTITTLSYLATSLPTWPPTATVETCLERVRALEPSIHAWVQVAPQPATGEGLLTGMPFGAKDIIETRGLATEYGSPIYKGRIGTTDAAIVEALRRRGAILFGKTQTTAFAYRTPPPTRNPHNLAHTPGGSSSGSAAAVAAGMVPFALGTQTQGSVLRPASYCGVTGFKPSYGVLSMEGVLPIAPTLDTLGLFTRTPAEMAALWEAMGYAVEDPGDCAIGFVDPLQPVDAAMRTAFDGAVVRLRDAGLSVHAIDLANTLETLAEANTTVMFYEAARFHERRYAEYGDQLEHLALLVRDGLRLTPAQYEQAKGHIRHWQTRLTEMFDATPIIVVPAATGPAPEGLSWTGDARMNAPWTALGTPAISIPLPVKGLPLGLQIVGAVGDDARVLHMAVRLGEILSANART
jgi:Asp-tRNA(Asn)/Glu-tRNA(Gln) amidotransferase A subunit family amidase